MNIHFSSATNEWATPQDTFDKLNAEFNFTLDPCASHENHKCTKYYTIEDDGLSKTWEGERVFCTPPYGREISEWVAKAAGEPCLTVMLIPARTDTTYWHEHIFDNPRVEIRFLKGRLKFGDAKNSAPFPSAVVIFNEMKKRMSLLPCPFCGGNDYHVEHYGWSVDGQQYHIICDNCAASGPICLCKELQKRWNKRI